MKPFNVLLTEAERDLLERYRSLRGLRSEAEAVRHMIAHAVISPAAQRVREWAVTQAEHLPTGPVSSVYGAGGGGGDRPMTPQERANHANQFSLPSEASGASGYPRQANTGTSRTANVPLMASRRKKRERV